MKYKCFCLYALCFFSSWAYSCIPGSSMGFMDDVTLPNSLVGELQGNIQLMQSSVISPDSPETTPKITTHKAALLLYTPQNETKGEHAQYSVLIKRGSETLKTIRLREPEKLPLSDQGLKTPYRPCIQYSLNARSAMIPWSVVEKGMSIVIRNEVNGAEGLLESQKLHFTAPTELVLNFVNLGMLTPPRAKNIFQLNAGLSGVDYMQRVPISKLVVAQYLPIYFPKIIFPDGKTYTEVSDMNGSSHRGDMRENIAKLLVSTGINNANFGILDLPGNSKKQAGVYKHVVVAQPVGKYQNGIIRHGLSGGNGMALLLRVQGNEFSHELGHIFGIGHYPGGGENSIHSASSGWGYDNFKHRLIANFRWDRDAVPTTKKGVTRPPFKNLFAFNTDAMAGGKPTGAVSRYTLHTPYTLKKIQAKFEKSRRLIKRSKTGYHRWNNETGKMEPEEVAVYKKPSKFSVPVVTLVGYYDPSLALPGMIYPPMYGNRGNVFSFGRHYPGSNGCWLSLVSEKGIETIQLNNKRYHPNYMNKFFVNLPMSRNYHEASLYCMRDYEAVLISQQKIQAPAISDLPKVKILGEQHEYKSIEDFYHAHPLKYTKYKSIEDFERDVQKLYGDIHRFNREEGRSEMGYQYAIYVRPRGDDRDYFMLKRIRYSLFPRTNKDNFSWRYMGTYSDFAAQNK